MPDLRYTREELEAILAARDRAGLEEGKGEMGFVELRIRFTPEILRLVLDGSFTVTGAVRPGDPPRTKTVRLLGVTFDETGLAQPQFEEVSDGIVG